MHMRPQDGRMAGPKTRPVKSAEDFVLLQGRVPETARERYKAAAAVTGVSMAFYLEKLADYLDEHDAWPAVPKPVPRANMLDLESLEANTAAA